MTRFLRVSVLALAPLVLAACASSIVGGECAEGTMRAGTACLRVDAGLVDASMDAVVGRDLGLVDGMVTDAIAMDGMATDAGPMDGGSHPPPCGIGEIECSGACFVGTRDRLHCGSCTNACAVGDVCAAGVCTSLCIAPLVQCGLECIDTTLDPDHCGDCTTTCPSGICIDSVCSAGRVGHVVVMGHDYQTSRPSQDLVLGNAVLISIARPIRLLTYPGSARGSAVAGADNAVDTTAAMRGATITRTSAMAAADVPLRLASADVFLIYPQRGSIDSDLTALGTSWSTALTDFVTRGGIVISLDDASAVNAGTWQILASAGLFHATGRTAISGTNVNVIAGGDAVALGVPSPYRAGTESVRFMSTDTTDVIDDGMGPVVIHRSLTP